MSTQNLLTATVCTALLAFGLGLQNPAATAAGETWERKLERASELFSQGAVDESRQLARDAPATSPRRSSRRPAAAWPPP